jgi:hypothetical protein
MHSLSCTTLHILLSFDDDDDSSEYDLSVIQYTWLGVVTSHKNRTSIVQPNQQLGGFCHQDLNVKSAVINLKRVKKVPILKGNQVNIYAKTPTPTSWDI